MIHRTRKLKDQRYDRSPLGKARRRRYAKSEKGRATRKRYEQSVKRRAARARYRVSPKGRGVQRRYGERVRRKRQPLPSSPFKRDWMKEFRGSSLNER